MTEPERRLQPGEVEGLVARPLAGRTLGTHEAGGFVLAEWSDDGGRPGMPIAPPHVHLDEDEAWIVLEGRLGFRLGDREIDAEPGTAVFGPRGLAHTYWNPQPSLARYLLVMGSRTSALLEALHDGTPRDRDEMVELFRLHGVRLL